MRCQSFSIASAYDSCTIFKNQNNISKIRSTSMAKGIIIAGERSGVGKTSLTLALVQCFLNRGLKVQCFKVGPDFIDTRPSCGGERQGVAQS